MGSLWLVRDRGLTNCVCSKPGRRNQLPALAGRARPSDSLVILFLLDPRLSRPLPNCLRVVPDEILTHLNVSLKQAELGRNGCCPPKCARLFHSWHFLHHHSLHQHTRKAMYCQLTWILILSPSPTICMISRQVNSVFLSLGFLT